MWKNVRHVQMAPMAACRDLARGFPLKFMQEKPTSVLVVAAALIDPAGQVCLQRRPEGKAHGGLWEFPGGKVERGESPAGALVREIAEELGIALAEADLRPCGFAGDDRVVILLYACRRWVGVAQALEGGALGWFAPAELAVRPMPPLDYPLARAVTDLIAAHAI
jgi:8-oxo-dGTP diphosphatase